MADAPITLPVDQITPLLDTAQTAERITAVKRMYRENLLRLRRLRGVPMAGPKGPEQVLLHRSAAKAMYLTWYRWLQTEAANAPITEDEKEAARQALDDTGIIGLVTNWAINQMQDTPYSGLAPNMLTFLRDVSALEHRFEKAIDSGSLPLSQNERVCYDWLRPYFSNNRAKRPHIITPGAAEAVWTAFDYMTRLLLQHRDTTGRTVTPDELRVVTSFVHGRFVQDSYDTRMGNIDRAQYDILGRDPFTMEFDQAGTLAAVGRKAVDADDLAKAREHPHIQTVYQQQIRVFLSTGCPVVHAKVPPAVAKPNNYIINFMDGLVASVEAGVFNPEGRNDKLYYRPPLRDEDPRPLPKRAPPKDALES